MRRRRFSPCARRFSAAAFATRRKRSARSGRRSRSRRTTRRSGARSSQRSRRSDDARPLKDGLVELATKATSPEASIDALARAAQLDELVLGHDDSAHALLTRAIALDPDDAGLEERRARIEARRRGGPRTQPTAEESERTLKADPSSAHALRARELAARRAGAAPRQANALSAQAEAWHGAPARLGALYGLFDLVEWTLPASDPAPRCSTRSSPSRPTTSRPSTRARAAR